MSPDAATIASVCPLCGSLRDPSLRVITSDFEHASSERVVLAGCRNCGLLVQEPRPTREDLLRAYPDDYHAYHEYASALMARIKGWYYVRRAHGYGRLIGRREARVLDVGCGDGSFMVALKRAFPAWDVRGVDFNPRIVALGRARGLQIEVGTLEDVAFPSETFDLIVMNHMIEHAFDPLATLGECWRILRPGGLCVGETPNVDCWDFDVFAGYWGGLHAPRHTMLFTPTALELAARRVGFDVAWIRHAVQPAHLALSVQHRLQASRLTRIALRNGRAFYYPYLLILMLPVALAQVLRGRSGVINFALRRQG